MSALPPFDARVRSVGSLLSDDVPLVVPGYQRSYAWTPEKAGQLLEDLLAALGNGDGEGRGDYFLGALVLMDTGGAGPEGNLPSERVHEIVDGLQRLATLTVLLAVLRDVSEYEDGEAAAIAARCIGAEDALATSFKLRLPVDVQDFFLDFVQEPRATSAMPDDELLPVEARILAVREHLMSEVLEEDSERRGQLVRFIAERCYCAVITSSSIDRAHQIFAVLNNRGQPLTRGDILKAELAGSIAPARREEFQKAWADAERQLGGSLEDLLGLVRTIEGRSRSAIIDDIRVLVERSGDAERFLRGVILPYANILGAIKGAMRGEQGLPAAIRQRIVYLGWLGSSDWMAPLMLFWRLVGGNPPELEGFLERLDRIAYGLKVLGIGGEKRAIRYREIMEATKTGRLSEPGGPLELARDEKRLILFNLRSMYSRNQMACRLVLLRINDELEGTPANLDNAGLTVEHVLPQKPARASQWTEWFTPPERERYTQSLGNLILVPRQGNEQARNLELARKLEIYFGGAVRQPQISREIEKLAEWRPETVAAREARMLDVLTRLWRLGSESLQSEEPVQDPSPRRRQAKATRRRGA